MSLSETIKKKAAGLAASAVAKAEEAKVQKQATDSDKIAAIDQKIEALRKQGGFAGTINRLKQQKAQLKNKIRNNMKK